MQFFKTVEGMLSHQFEQDGEKDDNGQPIKATEQPMSEDEYVAYKGKTLKEHLSGKSNCICNSDLVRSKQNK
jgi:hypothetical protein